VLVTVAGTAGEAPPSETTSRGATGAYDVTRSPTDGASAGERRPVYRYSVITGGVYSARELARALSADAVVAAHHASVAIDRVRVETVLEPRHVYVSYRQEDRIYWTKNRVTLAPGESILTDGRVEIRARCGNGVSSTPMSPTSTREPLPEEFDAHVNLPGSPSDVVSYPGPALWPGGLPVELQAPAPSTWDVLEVPSSGVLFPLFFVGGSSTSTGTGLTPLPPGVTQDPWGVDDLADPPVGGFPLGTPGDDIFIRNVGSSGQDPWPTTSRPVPVPEPSVLLMLGLGGAAVLALRRH
jgi:hypothetical protein